MSFSCHFQTLLHTFPIDRVFPPLWNGVKRTFLSLFVVVVVVVGATAAAIIIFLSFLLSSFSSPLVLLVFKSKCYIVWRCAFSCSFAFKLCHVRLPLFLTRFHSSIHVYMYIYVCVYVVFVFVYFIYLKLYELVHIIRCFFSTLFLFLVFDKVFRSRVSLL